MAIATSPTGSVSGTGTAGTIPIWSNSVTIGNSLLTQSTTTVTLTGGATATNTGFYDLASINDFLQYDLKNTSTGTSAQSTYSLTADNGSLTTGFMSININNSTFTAVNNYSIGVANDCSVLASGQDLYVANSHISKDIIFSTGKTASPFFDERFRLQNASNVGGALFTLGNSLVVRTAATQDSIAIAGRAGGASSFVATLTPTTLTASRTATLPDKNGTLAMTSDLGGAFSWNRTLQEFSSPAAQIGGYTWAARTLSVAGSWTAMTYGNRTFVAVSSGSTNATTSPDGITWTTRTLPSSSNWAAIAFGNGLFVATSATTATATSPDGITWTARTIPSSPNAITYGNGLFLVVTTGTVAYTSPDGITWTSRTLPSSSSWASAAYGNGTFVIAASGPSTAAASSPDGITWTARTMPSSAAWGSITYGNGGFVAISQTAASTVAASSPDGATWTARTLPTSATWNSVGFGNGVFVAISNSSTAAASSPDGITWTARTLPSAASWSALAYGNGVFSIVAGGSSTNAASSGGSLTLTGDFTASRLLNLPDADVTITAGTSIAGSIANTQVAVGNGVNTVAGSSALTFSSNTFVVGTSSGADGNFVLKSAAATAGDKSQLIFSTAFNKFNFVLNGAEAGSDAGSNLILKAFTDAGASIDSPLTIVRAAGGPVTIGRNTIVNGNLTMTGQIAATLTGAGLQNTLRMANLQAAAAGVGSYIQFQGIGPLSQGAIACAWTGAATTDAYMDFYSVTGSTQTARVRLSAAGNLLIGTTADTGISGAGGVSIANTTDSTTTANGAIITAGGLGVAKRSFLGTIGATFKGNVQAGVQDATAAVAGQVGEPASSVVSAVAVAATGTVGNVTSITLQPGAWSIRAFAVVAGGATGLTAASTINISIVTTTATNGVAGSTMAQETIESAGALSNGLYNLAVFPIDVNISVATTYYLTEQVSYIAGSPTVSATLAATRTR